MKRELIKITRELKQWCKKNNKAYISMFVIDDHASVSISHDDKDYKEFSFFIDKNDEVCFVYKELFDMVEDDEKNE